MSDHPRERNATRMRNLRRVVGASLLLVVAAGCSGYNSERGVGDAPVGPQDKSAAEVVVFSDKFMNVETKCNHGNRIYSHSREAAPVVVPNDPSCPKS